MRAGERRAGERIGTWQHREMNTPGGRQGLTDLQTPAKGRGSGRDPRLEVKIGFYPA